MSDTTFNVTIRATSIVVYPAQEAMILLQPLLLQHEYEDEYQQTVNVLGYMYDEGRGIGQDYKQALNWYRKAVEQGNADAQCNLGNCYYNGNGVTKDYSQAVN